MSCDTPRRVPEKFVTLGQFVILGLVGSVMLAAAAETAVPPPSEPGNFTATSLGETSIRLTWLDSSNEQKYVIQRRLGGTIDRWVAIAKLAADTLSYTDTALPAGTTFDYRIRAQAGREASNWVATSGSTDAPALIAPSNLQTSFVSDGRIELFWTENSANARHRVERRSDRAGDDWTLVADVAAGTGAAGWQDPDVIIDDHDPTEYAYRVSAVNASTQSATIKQWAPICAAAPANPEQAWLDDLASRISPDAWSSNPATLPPPSESVSAKGWNKNGTACAADANGHFPCDYVMIGNDRYLALFVAGAVTQVGAGNGQVNAGGLIGLTQRRYGMEMIRWDASENQHIWKMFVALESNLQSETQYAGGFQQSALHSVKLETIGGEPTLVFEWRLSGPGQGQNVKTFWTLASRGLTGLHGRIEVTGTRADRQGITQVLFPNVTSLGDFTPEHPDVVVPSAGLGVRFRDFYRAYFGDYLSTSLSAQFMSIEKHPYAMYAAVEDGQSASDPDLHSKALRYQHHGGATALDVYHYPDHGAGVAGNSLIHGTGVYAPICGDWRRVAKRYRRFALQQSWASVPLDQRTDIPESVKQSLFLFIEDHGIQDAEFYRVSANYLKQLLVDGSQARDGSGNPPPEPADFSVPPFPDGPPIGFHLYDWYTPLFDTGAPTFDPKPGIENTFASIQADGTSIAIPYINVAYADITNGAPPPADPQFWKTFTKKRVDGVTTYDTGVLQTGRIYGSIAINSATWRSVFDGLVASVFGLGAKGIYLDTFGGSNHPDYDSDLSARDVGSQFKGYGPWIAGSSQQLGDIAKSYSALAPDRVVTAEHFSEAYIDKVDLVLLYQPPGGLEPSNLDAPVDELTEIVGLVPAVYSDYQAHSAFLSSANEDPRPAAMKHAAGFVLGGHVGPVGRGTIGIKSDFPYTICDANYSEPSPYLWVIEQGIGCEPRLAYLTTLAHARFYRERYFRGEYLGPAEDRSADQMITDYWCRTHDCAPTGNPLPTDDLCTNGNQPDDPSCASRFRKVVLPAVRGGTWVSPDGDRAIILTNTDAVSRTVDVPVPRSWDAAFDAADLCRADVRDPQSTGDCSSVSVAGGVAAGVTLPAYSAYFLQFGPKAP